MGGIDRVTEEFWDIVCADPELVELEFRAIMACVRDEPGTGAVLRDRSAASSASSPGALTDPGADAIFTRRRALSSIRSPPKPGADSVGN